MEPSTRAVYGYIFLLLLALAVINLVGFELTSRTVLGGFLYASVSNDVVHMRVGSRANVSKSRDLQKRETSKSGNTSLSVLTSQTGMQNCSRLTMPLKLLQKDSWLPVNKGRDGFVFSAYYIDTDKEIVLVGAMVKVAKLIYCRIWYKNSNGSFRVEITTAFIKFLPEDHSHRYAAVLFRCQEVEASSLPMYVALTEERCTDPLNLLLVSPRTETGTLGRNFTICPEPLFNNFSNDHKLVEWIELNRILGGDKFIFYNHSSANNVKRVLDLYSERGLAEVIQWRPPMVSQNATSEIHNIGQVAALNDCLYRNTYQSKFLVVLDTDEFIIPHSKNVSSWGAMLKQVRNSSTYIFRNTFFKAKWNKPQVTISNKTEVEMLKLITLQKVLREKRVFPAEIRSKYITRPSDVSSLMIHTVRHSLRVKVQPEVALLHHYRDTDISNDDKRETTLDRTVPDKFEEVLIRNVGSIWKELDRGN